MDTPLKFKTIVAASSAEFRDRGSKFLAFAYPVKTVGEAKTKIKLLKAGHPKAAHHCVAYRLGNDDTLHRASDDGEPSGSAGRPMLGAIDSAGLTNVLVVVARYFGGTLLGIPGLIHAYGSAAASALAAAQIAEHWVEKTFTIECNYATLTEVLYILRRHDAGIQRQDLQLFCTIRAGIPLHTADTCVRLLSELRGVHVKAASD